jgi:hypothetical protein
MVIWLMYLIDKDVTYIRGLRFKMIYRRFSQVNLGMQQLLSTSHIKFEGFDAFATKIMEGRDEYSRSLIIEATYGSKWCKVPCNEAIVPLLCAYFGVPQPKSPITRGPARPPFNPEEYIGMYDWIDEHIHLPEKCFMNTLVHELCHHIAMKKYGHMAWFDAHGVEFCRILRAAFKFLNRRKIRQRMMRA